jgi:hypothetical protein
MTKPAVLAPSRSSTEDPARPLAVPERLTTQARRLVARANSLEPRASPSPIAAVASLTIEPPRSVVVPTSSTDPTSPLLVAVVPPLSTPPLLEHAVVARPFTRQPNRLAVRALWSTVPMPSAVVPARVRELETHAVVPRSTILPLRNAVRATTSVPVTLVVVLKPMIPPPSSVVLTNKKKKKKKQNQTQIKT